MRTLRPIRRTLAVALAAGALLTASACGSDDLSSDNSSSGDKGVTVRLASQNFDEAVLVTTMYQQVLENAGYTVPDPTYVDSRDVYMAKFPGDFDVVPEYVAGIGDFLNIDQNGEDAKPVTTNDTDESLQAMQPLLDKAGITLLDPSPAASQNAFFVTKDYSEQNGVTKLSDLQGKSITLAAPPDCKGRSDCEGGLTNVYGIDIQKILPLGYATPETYKSVLDGESQLGETGTLDGTLADQGLVLLQDDKGIQPAQNLIPAVSSDFLKDNPDIKDPLNSLMAALDNQTLGELIARVTVDREKPEDVASGFLKDKGLID